jgi:hypothetical protein
LPLRLINRHCKTQPHWKLFPTVLLSTFSYIGSKRPGSPNGYRKT